MLKSNKDRWKVILMKRDVRIISLYSISGKNDGQESLMSL